MRFPCTSFPCLNAKGLASTAASRVIQRIILRFAESVKGWSSKICNDSSSNGVYFACTRPVDPSMVLWEPFEGRDSDVKAD